MTILNMTRLLTMAHEVNFDLQSEPVSLVEGTQIDDSTFCHSIFERPALVIPSTLSDWRHVEDKLFLQREQVHSPFHFQGPTFADL